MDIGSWRNVVEAAEYYHRSAGYTYIHTPWIQNNEYLDITCPNRKGTLAVGNSRGLVGSAEQSFIAMALSGLPDGKYVSIGPCFRNEPLFDEIHQESFLKTELFITGFESAQETLENMLVHTHHCFTNIIGCDDNKIDAKITASGVDITLNGIEIGSYGVRQYKHLTWVYGTGLAEPRFSYARNLP